ncbi:hypothetical protein BKH46_08280 [Helicobacter sp. 12S02634-8]|uniref:hypothetical protein n=1 Tax=Helicobacter sp. 12S02634-8 TaxID=1476199 RepID=UPI000BA713B0|nr:hypothetical protein [Helicobacter sp. 12S02634-8]PAF46227.1 hypothetical protein BKH46_08280 [Helicobacter sp. 12S02634-8]
MQIMLLSKNLSPDLFYGETPVEAFKDFILTLARAREYYQKIGPVAILIYNEDAEHDIDFDDYYLYDATEFWKRFDTGDFEFTPPEYKKQIS